MTKNEKKFPEIEMATINLSKKIQLILGLIKFVSCVFMSAIIFVVLAHFVPELREQMPSFYKLIDSLLACMEWLCTKMWSLF